MHIPALVTVMLVDDHDLVRQGVRSILETAGGFEVVAEARSVRQAVAEAARTRPQVVVMDVRLGDGSGIEATRDIRATHGNTRVLMLTSFADDSALLASIMAGASGYVLKQVRGSELVSAIRAVAAGRNLLDQVLADEVIERLARGKHLVQDGRLALLTGQEERVLALITDGLTNREIGARLGLAEKTVKNYISTIFGKLEVTHRSGAAAYLARHSSDGR